MFFIFSTFCLSMSECHLSLTSSLSGSSDKSTGSQSIHSNSDGSVWQIGKIFGLGGQHQKSLSNLDDAINVPRDICNTLIFLAFLFIFFLAYHVCDILWRHDVISYDVEQKIFKRYLGAGGRHQDK